MKRYRCDSFDRKALPARTRSLLKEIIADILAVKIKSNFLEYYLCYLEDDEEKDKQYNDKVKELAFEDKPRFYSKVLTTLLTRHKGYIKMLSAGYYGPHGKYIICKAILRYMKEDVYINSTFRKQNLSIQYKTFVDYVLAPEVVIRLIMEDQLVDYSTAHKITIDTSDLGGILHADSDGSDLD